MRDFPRLWGTGRRFTQAFGDEGKQKEIAKKTVEAGLEGLTPEEREAAIHLIKALFPRVGTIFGGMSYGDSWDSTWTLGRRIASDDYFRRYFQYGVPTRDIPDSDIDAFINSANSADEKAATAFLKKVTQRKAWRSVLDKLIAKLGRLNETGAGRVAVALAFHSEQIPYEQGMFAEILGSRIRAAKLTVQMVQSIQDQKQRLALAGEVMQAASSLSFGTACLDWLGFQSENNEETTALAEDELKHVGSILASRIAADISGNPHYARHGRDISALLHIWKKYGPNDEMVSYLTDRFDKSPDEAIRLLDAFVLRAWGLESGLSHKSQFDRSQFDAIAKVIDPGIVIAALKKTFGPQLDDATFDKCWKLSGDQQTACRFVAIFKKVQEENAQKLAATKTPEPVQSDSKAVTEEK